MLKHYSAVCHLAFALINLARRRLLARLRQDAPAAVAALGAGVDAP